MTYQQMLAFMKKELEELEERIAAAEKAAEEWPQVDDGYWVLDSEGVPFYGYWTGYSVDEYRAGIGNIFRTKKKPSAWCSD